MFAIIAKRKAWFILSVLLVGLSVAAILRWQLRLGIDFTGGSLLEVTFPQRPSVADVRQIVQEVSGEVSVTVQPIGEQGIMVRFPHVTQAVHQQLFDRLAKDFPGAEEQRFDAVGPTIGDELRRKTLWAVVLAVVGMITYISLAFRKVHRPVPSWQYGSIAILALVHDLVITIGIFAALGYFYGLEVNAPFVAALLTVFGYSVNDTIVVFDRVRDNLLHHPAANFDELVETSIRQTIVRSTNTALPTLLTLLVILTFGGETIRDFALALIIGIVIGTYSSIFVACPLLVEAQRLRHHRKH
ncbi:MAG: protein-export membrane protein, SecD/SecF family [Parcubacteria group bacterium Gr01-1014_31]|nr:MAG: protein-export membrane protein, SecD/SecF family [Parcubacteria group bacterium Gr01-1014_31]